MMRGWRSIETSSSGAEKMRRREGSLQEKVSSRNRHPPLLVVGGRSPPPSTASLDVCAKAPTHIQSTSQPLRPSYHHALHLDRDIPNLLASPHPTPQEETGSTKAEREEKQNQKNQTHAPTIIIIMRRSAQLCRLAGTHPVPACRWLDPGRKQRHTERDGLFFLPLSPCTLQIGSARPVLVSLSARGSLRRVRATTLSLLKDVDHPRPRGGRRVGGVDERAQRRETLLHPPSSAL
jgi:hypothetical protein